MVWDEWHKQGKVMEAIWDDGKGRKSDEEDVGAKRCGQKRCGIGDGRRESVDKTI